VRILGLSSYDDQHYIQGMLESGAAGYLTKDEAPQLLVQAVRGVAQGEEGWFSQRVASKMATWAEKKPAQLIVLSHQEKALLRLLVAGKTRRDIAEALSLSQPEVEEHLEALLAKLGVDSSIEAAIRAVQERLV
jgi:two-component system NarL family response regulator